MSFLSFLNPFRKKVSMEDMRAKDRAVYLSRKGHNSKTRIEYLKKSIDLIDTTDSPLTKLYRAKEFGIRQGDPLVWLNLVLALYDQGRDIFGYPDLSLEVRNALTESKKPPKDPQEKPEPLAELFAVAIEKEMAARKLFNSTTLAPQHASPMTEALPGSEVR